MTRRKRKAPRIPRRVDDNQETGPNPPPGFEISELRAWCSSHGPLVVSLVAGVLASFCWAYWPTLVLLVESWESQPDYSHGFLVPPLAIFFLYLRRDRLPEHWRPALIAGTLLIGASVAVRWFGARIYLDALDGYSILLWASGLVTLFFGWRMLLWSAPSLLFLVFMIPLPYRVETALRLPLQALATKASTYVLVVLGQPAIAEANVIRIGETSFGVAEACSGLRIFVGILALAVGYIIAVRRPWWIKGLLLCSVLPVTLVANCTRIVGTCLLELQFSSAVAQKFSHDIAGLVMIPFAALLFGGILWYLVSLGRWQASVPVEQLVKRQVSA